MCYIESDQIYNRDNNKSVVHSKWVGISISMHIKVTSRRKSYNHEYQVHADNDSKNKLDDAPIPKANQSISQDISSTIWNKNKPKCSTQR